VAHTGRQRADEALAVAVAIGDTLRNAALAVELVADSYRLLEWFELFSSIAHGDVSLVAKGLRRACGYADKRARRRGGQL